MDSIVDKREDYSPAVEVRNVDIMGETKWFWVKGDEGGFGHAKDGPMRDWIDSHSQKYFKYVRDKKVIVTGGTSCGIHVRFYAKEFDTVYAFEPDPLSFYCMSLNAPYENVVKLNAALGHQNMMIDINRNSRNIGAQHVIAPGKHYIPMMTIDQLNLHTCDLIQLDVERLEMQAIEGAKETIAKFKPVVIAEMFHDVSQVRYMDSLGYKFAEKSFMDSIYIPK